MSLHPFDANEKADAVPEQDENALNTALSTIEIDAAKNYYSRWIDLYVFDVPNFSNSPYGRNSVGIMETPVFRTTPLGMSRDPSFHLSFEAAQRLLDALLAAGVRPSEEWTAGQIAAMKAHLDDMRRIVFDFIGKPPRIINTGDGLERIYKMAVEDEEIRKGMADFKKKL